MTLMLGKSGLPIQVLHQYYLDGVLAISSQIAENTSAQCNGSDDER